ncbi:hypothetical protein [Spirosoma horti]
MPTLVFKARLSKQEENRSADIVRILFGLETKAEKEQLFRAFCEARYPGWIIEEPLSISISKLNLKR